MIGLRSIRNRGVGEWGIRIRLHFRGLGAWRLVRLLVGERVSFDVGYTVGLARFQCAVSVFISCF